MSVPEILRLEAQLQKEAGNRHKKRGAGNAKDSTLRHPISVCKKMIAHTLADLNLVGDRFSGKLIISFKEGGISYIEKVEQFK
jgi:hypothetical protein